MGNTVICWLLCCFASQLVSDVSMIGADHVTREVTTVGLSVTLSCNAEDPDQAAMLTWWSPRNELLTMDYDRQTVDDRFTVQRGYQRERNLEISNVRTADAGHYTCRLSQDRTRATVLLVINVPPSIVNISRDVRKHVGSDVILQCNAVGYPQPQVTWYKVRGDVEKKILVSEGGSLSLTSVTRFNAGVYSCHADNGVPPAVSKRVRLDIIFSPVLALPYRQMVQSIGTDALLTCLVYAFPPAELMWVRGNERLPTTGNEKYRVQNWTVDEYSILYGLHISSITTSDYGTYHCSARNDFGTDKAQMVIYELNDNGPATLPLVRPDSSVNRVLLGVIVTLVVVVIALLALTVTLCVKVRKLTAQKREEATKRERLSDQRATAPDYDDHSGSKTTSVSTKPHTDSVRDTRL